MAEDFSRERERIEQRLAETERRLQAIEARPPTDEQRKELVRRYTHVEHLTREMVEFFIDYIAVGKRISGTRNIPIEIHWNF